MYVRCLAQSLAQRKNTESVDSLILLSWVFLTRLRGLPYLAFSKRWGCGKSWEEGQWRYWASKLVGCIPPWEAQGVFT